MKKLVFLLLALTFIFSCSKPDISDEPNEQATEKLCSTNSNGNPIPCPPDDDNGEG